jgi:hypothetical protein
MRKEVPKKNRKKNLRIKIINGQLRKTATNIS